jgi:hypothetical protein
VWRVGAIALIGSAAALASAQTRDAPSESQVRGWVRQAARDRRGDPSEIVLEIDRRVRERWGDFESFPLTIVQDEDLLVTVAAPYMAFRNSLVDMLRSGRPVGQAVWTGMVVVQITPRRLGAVDIELVALSRDGRPLAPLRHALRPMRFSNGTGEERTIHAGEVGFAPAAFSPGGTVVLTLNPRAGQPIVHAFSEDELGTLK